MAFTRPTRTTIQSRVAADIERHSGQKASSRGDVYYPLAQAIAGVAHGLHGHLQYNVDQIFDESCDDENLLRRAAEMGIYRIRAYRASGTITVTGNDGAEILEQTLLQTDDEIRYRTTSAAVIENGEATVSVTAVESGSDGNQSEGASMSFITTQLDVDSEVTVISITGGSDIESIDRVRERLATRRTTPAMGGNKNDYIQWALEAHSDVTRAWCYPLEKGLGTVVVRFVTDDLEDGPIPSDTHILAVKEYIDELRPVGMKQFSIGELDELKLDLEFTKLTPNTNEVREAVQNELEDMLLRLSEPGGTILISKIHEAISLADGEEDFQVSIPSVNSLGGDITFTEDGNVTCQVGELIVLGDITWPAT